MTMKPLVRSRAVSASWILVGLILIAACAAVAWNASLGSASHMSRPRPGIAYKPRKPLDTGGFSMLSYGMDRWAPDASMEEIAQIWDRPGLRFAARLDEYMNQVKLPPTKQTATMLLKAVYLNSEGEAEKAYKVLEEMRAYVEANDRLAAEWRYSVIFYQGVTALRRGENENCVMCRGESACILPIVPSAIHLKPEGSRRAIEHFTEYLEKFPDDLEVRWVLNIAAMTLGEHPSHVDSRYLISIDHYLNSEFDIGKFREISYQLGVDRNNQAGGGLMEDFDNDGLLDIAATSLDPAQPMSYCRNKGDGTFEDRSEESGVSKQLGGMLTVPTDYNNDGFTDLFISRGAWVIFPMRSTLLRNNGNGTFTDVTVEAGLNRPMNSLSNSWADYDNDGWLDLFICGERQSNRLYRNKHDGTFEDVTDAAGLRSDELPLCKGAAWIDFDNDDDLDVYLTFQMPDGARFYRNNGDGTFTEISESLGIDGPKVAFACWAWDYDNDGWLDLYANSYDRTLGDAVKGLLGQPHSRYSNKLYHNLKGKGFQDVTKEAGLDMVFISMGSNFGDIDNDGWLDMYLGTGDPNFETLVPNRLFKNVGGKRFADISASSGTGHLQKGHSVSFGDWDRDGDLDLFVQTGGTINGDRFHNLLFQNPGQGNRSITLKLVGKTSNRPGIGARIKIVTAGETPMTIHRHVSSGGSWGANPLEQTIGLGKADRIARLEIHWPTSKTTQVFRDIDANQIVEVAEFADHYRTLSRKPIPTPQ